MKFKIKTAAALFVAVAAMSTARLATAQSPNDPNWQKLAEAKPGHEPEHDVFELDPHAGKYTKIRFRVRGKAVHFMHIRVTFGNDDKQDIKLDKTVDDDAGTGALDLHGAPREIKRVDVDYVTVGHRRIEGFVTLWGYR